ncbi:exopolysaccharide biosynthesis protein [Rhodobacterales bacterium]|nr:exopolysaccharide biosynthesis protein [Rhodobacterales bacterium]
MNESQDDIHSLGEVIDRTCEVARRKEVSVGHILGAFGQAGFPPLLFVPALAVVTPLSGIPAFSSLCGIMIFLIAGQWMIGRTRVWIPRWLRTRRLSGARLREAIEKVRPAADWLDRHSRKRLRFLFHRPLRYLLPVTCMMFGAMMPLLEFVPFSSSFLGAAVCLIAFSLITRDGLYALIALVPVGGVIWMVSYLIR